MPVRKICVLVVDDDKHMLRLMRRLLEVEGYQVVSAANGEDALSLLDQENPDLVLLDVMMPGMDGYEICRQIRDFSQTPIMMVTAKGEENERVWGLDLGADDYITKPFSARELAARVKAVLRRSRLWDKHPNSAVRSDGLVVDFTQHRVILDGRDIRMTATEYRLLSYLARNIGNLVTPDQLLEAVWDGDYVGDHHIVRVNIARLRQKLGDNPNTPRFIATRIGIGYMLLRSR